MTALSIIIPVYNEAMVLPLLYDKLLDVLPGIKAQLAVFSGKDSSDESVEILFVNDGSTDNTAGILESFVHTNPIFRVLTLSRNFGHQPALLAGLTHCRGSLVVMMDADLQDPPELIPEMINKCIEGFDVVHAVRRSRKAVFYKRVLYKIYYKINVFLSDDPVQKDSGDFCLMTHRVVEVIRNLPEKQVYLRGLRAWVGFKQTVLPFDRKERPRGKTKYSLTSLFKLATSGITSTSTKPLLVAGFFSIVCLLIIVGLLLYALIPHFFFDVYDIPKGWASIMITMSILSAFQLFSLLLLSLYMAKVYREVLGRPAYIIKDESGAHDKNPLQF